MVGFLGITLAILIALALLSYSPHDSSFNVASQAPESHPALNWIGPAGAYGADLLFQVFGYAAFLLPMGICALGLRWFRSRPLDSAVATLVGYAMLIVSVPSLLALWRLPDVRGAIPPGGLLGTLLADGLHAAFNSVGAHVVAAGHIFHRAVPDDLILLYRHARAGARAHCKSWTPSAGSRRAGSPGARRASKRGCAQRVEINKTAGRQPVPTQAFAAQIAGKLPADSDADDREEALRTRASETRSAAPLLVFPEAAGEAEAGQRRSAALNPRSRAARPASGFPRPGFCAWPSAAKRCRKTN